MATAAEIAVLVCSGSPSLLTSSSWLRVWLLTDV